MVDHEVVLVAVEDGEDVKAVGPGEGGVDLEANAPEVEGAADVEKSKVVFVKPRLVENDRAKLGDGEENLGEIEARRLRWLRAPGWG